MSAIALRNVWVEYGEQIVLERINLDIASGAFSLSKPSDLIPELQGRLPIRVELDSLKVGDFVRILTEPDASLTTQYKALMATEGVQVEFSTDGVRRIALVTHAWHMPRAVQAFERAGLQVVPAPTGFTRPQQRALLEWLPSGSGLQSSREILREWLGMRIAGRI